MINMPHGLRRMADFVLEKLHIFPEKLIFSRKMTHYWSHVVSPKGVNHHIHTDPTEEGHGIFQNLLLIGSGFLLAPLKLEAGCATTEGGVCAVMLMREWARGGGWFVSQNTMHLSAGKLWKLRYYWSISSLSPCSPVLAPPSGDRREKHLQHLFMLKCI